MKTNRDGQGPLFEEGPRSIRSYGDAGHNTLELVIFSSTESFFFTQLGKVYYLRIECAGFAAL